MSAEPEGEVGRLHELAIRALMRGEQDEARALLEQALQRADELYDPEDREVAGVANALGSLHQAQGRYAEAEACYFRALASLESAGSASGELIGATADLAKLYLAQGRLAEAEQFALRSLEVVGQLGGAAEMAAAKVRRILSRIYARQGRHSEAEQMQDQSQAAVGQFMAPMFAAFESAIRDMSSQMVDLSVEECREIEPLVRRSVQMTAQLVGPDHPSLIATLDQHAFILRKMEREEEAAEIEAQVRRIRDRHS